MLSESKLRFMEPMSEITAPEGSSYWFVIRHILPELYNLHQIHPHLRIGQKNASMRKFALVIFLHFDWFFLFAVGYSVKRCSVFMIVPRTFVFKNVSNIFHKKKVKTFRVSSCQAFMLSKLYVFCSMSKISIPTIIYLYLLEL